MLVIFSSIFLVIFWQQSMPSIIFHLDAILSEKYCVSDHNVIIFNDHELFMLLLKMLCKTKLL